MSDTENGFEKADRPRASRRREAFIVAGMASLVILLTTVATLVKDDADTLPSTSAPSPGASSTRPTASPHEFAWPDAYAGPVWIRVRAADDAPRAVLLRWGPWERRIDQRAADVTYAFTKSITRPGDVNPRIVVTVQPDATAVTFGTGAAVPPSTNIDEGWIAAATTSSAQPPPSVSR